MIQNITLKNFRNFSHKEISFSGEKNFIIGNNGHGKTNILEALSLPYSPLLESKTEYLLKKESPTLFVAYTHTSGNFSFSYEGKSKKKKYIIGSKSTTKSKLTDIYPHVISFHPMMMNLMFLGPSERRKFLDEILNSAFPEYKKIYLAYKKVLMHRNKILHNIAQGKSHEDELIFWDKKFIDGAVMVYTYREKIKSFFEETIGSLQKYFLGKVDSIEFQYISKTSYQNDIREYLNLYIKENRSKEILLQKTLRGPHLDDFDILVDSTPLIHFASRGEIKSILIGLKFLETDFIRRHSHKEEILFLIDDILSELDTIHRDMLWEQVGSQQCIITSIEDFDIAGNKIYI